MDEGVDAVDGGGDPGDTEGNEEEGGSAAVVDGGTVGAFGDRVLIAGEESVTA